MPPSSSSSSAAAAAASPSFRHHHRLFSAARERRGLRARGVRPRPAAPLLSLSVDGPSCLFVGPIETASKERLEALYHQARDAYYSGKPLIVDDMFDKVEMKLRLYGSKSVVKYPRCSLKRHCTYSDAEEDPSQVLALATVWILLLAFGVSVSVLPLLYTINMSFGDTVNSRYFFRSERSPFELLPMLNILLFIGLGSLVGYPIASASARSFVGLWKNDLVALKGSCPNCGEEVFAFVRAEKSTLPPHRTECHVCECTLEFRTKVEQSADEPNRRWIYGRVYLIRKTSGRRRKRKQGYSFKMKQEKKLQPKQAKKLQPSTTLEMKADSSQEQKPPLFDLV